MGGTSNLIKYIGDPLNADYFIDQTNPSNIVIKGCQKANTHAIVNI